MVENDIKCEAALSQVFKQLNNMASTDDDMFSIVILTTHIESTVAIYFKSNKSLLVSPSVGKEKFLELVFFVLTLKFSQKDNEMEQWRGKALLEIKKFAESRVAKEDEQNGNSNNNSRMFTSQMIQSPPKIDEANETVLNKSNDSGIVCFDDDLIINQDVLYRNSSTWTKIGHGGCGAVFRVEIKVVCPKRI